MVRCSVCGRKFKLPLHLGRHMTSAHARPAKGSKVALRAKRKGRRARAMALPKASAGSLPDVTATLNSCCTQLAAQRAHMDAQISAMQAALTALGADSGATSRAVPRGARRAAFRAGSLKEYVVRVLRETRQVMTLPQIGEAVRKAGYKTRSRHLKAAITNVIGKLPGVRRVAFGQYRAG